MSDDWLGIAVSALDRRLDHASTAPLVVALSGGGDSLALLNIAMDWARSYGRPLLALTIDHGLNPVSACWTIEAGAKSQALGADWRALNWTGPKPTTGIQAKARAARHALLAEAAREAGASVILMGHTADDMAEGELMRAGEARGMGQVREWSPSPVWPAGRGVFLLRPLLGARRAELRAFLTSKSQTWLDDPSNEDQRFARIRARHAASDDTVLTSPGSEPAQPEVEMVEFTEERAIAPTLTSPRVLAALLLSVSGRAIPPRSAELARALEAIAARRVVTLSNCRIDARSSSVVIQRAPARRGVAPTFVEPSNWVRERFRAACGLVPTERKAFESARSFHSVELR